MRAHPRARVPLGQRVVTFRTEFRGGFIRTEFRADAEARVIRTAARISRSVALARVCFEFPAAAASVTSRPAGRPRCAPTCTHCATRRDADRDDADGSSSAKSHKGVRTGPRPAPPRPVRRRAVGPGAGRGGAPGQPTIN